MNIRPAVLSTDLPILNRWWDAHKALRVPELFLDGAIGFFAHAGGVDVAAAFLYLGIGCRFSVVEYITVNPACAQSRDSLSAVYALIAHAEKLSKEHGCRSVLSFVALGSSEERIMGKLGYETSVNREPGHRIWGKAIKEGG